MSVCVCLFVSVCWTHPLILDLSLLQRVSSLIQVCLQSSHPPGEGGREGGRGEGGKGGGGVEGKIKISQKKRVGV